MSQWLPLWPIKRTHVNDLIVVEKLAEWQRLKALVLDSVSSPITRRVYNMALDEFIGGYHQAPRPGFTKATVSTWRVSLEARGLGSSSIIIRMSAIRKLAVEATDNGLLAPELAAGICRVKSVKSQGVRRTNVKRALAAVAFLCSITPGRQQVTGYSIRGRPVAELDPVSFFWTLNSAADAEHSGWFNRIQSAAWIRQK